MRIEKGYLYWSGDITPEDNPLEAGLGMFVEMGKEDFIGREALEKMPGAGSGYQVDGSHYGCRRQPLWRRVGVIDGQVVDRIRSGNYGYTLGQDIGLVYLPLELAEIGRELEVQVMDRRVKARVAKLPLVDVKGEKIRA